jgi:hypothetical protein
VVAKIRGLGFLFAEPGADDEGAGREWTRDCDLGGGWYSISCRLNERRGAISFSHAFRSDGVI